LKNLFIKLKDLWDLKIFLGFMRFKEFFGIYWTSVRDSFK